MNGWTPLTNPADQSDPLCDARDLDPTKFDATTKQAYALADEAE